ncbi:unnamed protein product [Cladocopium goreaui]|uniref:Uncharacterized protein n=1 Tax=Cladocopium goreaui TaxID=2562237 RepID=A0A9P1CMA6_9DINO|nr:unnamed protein product [Cladocopium goreaui]
MALLGPSRLAGQFFPWFFQHFPATAEVCLAHHVLRGPPQVGLSRQNRLLNEKELLEELMSLRFWVGRLGSGHVWI